MSHWEMIVVATKIIGAELPIQLKHPFVRAGQKLRAPFAPIYDQI